MARQTVILNTMKTTDCIVIGAGVIGMTTARALALRGYNVTLFDKGMVGKEASWAAGGILSAMRPWSEHAYSASLSAASQACYPQFSAELQRETGIDTEYERTGLLMIGRDDVAPTKRWAMAHHRPFSETVAHLPAGFACPDEAVWLPEIAVIRPPRLLKALAASLRKYAVTVFENTPVSLDVVGDRCQAVVTATGSRYTACHVIVTAGAWSSRLATTALSIKPIRGQMLCLRPQRRLSTIVLDGGHYLIPRRDGHLLIGSTMEDVGFDKRTTTTARRQLLAWATSLWRDLADASLVSHWAGLRPAIADDKPFIGRLANYQNLYLNAGHFRKGILQAPAAADKIVDLLEP